MKQDFRFHTIRTVLAVVLALFSAAVAGAQGRFTVTGKVSDASGKPMVGVTIIEQGTTNGTTTGLDGTYSLVVKDDRSVLQFSSLGYTSQSVTVGSKNEIDVSLSEDAINMSEVVVTGYGRTVTKDKLTAAISKVSSDVLEKGVRSNALTALAGTVTGVRIASTTGQPGAAPSIVIRGGAALDGTGSPLYVIDGVQREDMNDINANDIESIEILKDAAATALYGARANAGVVLVTTKRGRVGRAEISFKANVGLNYLRKTNEFLEADDYLYYLRLASYRSGNIAALSAAGPFGTGNVLSADGNKSAEGVYSPMFLSDENAYLLKQGYKSMIDPITGKTIIYSEFTASDASVRDLALTQDYNISASGGNDRGRYYASLGYYDESGFPVISYYKRLSFVTNGSYKITPWLEDQFAQLLAFGQPPGERLHRRRRGQLLRYHVLGAPDDAALQSRRRGDHPDDQLGERQLGCCQEQLLPPQHELPLHDEPGPEFPPDGSHYVETERHVVFQHVREGEVQRNLSGQSRHLEQRPRRFGQLLADVVADLQRHRGV